MGNIGEPGGMDDADGVREQAEVLYVLAFITFGPMFARMLTFWLAL